MKKSLLVVAVLTFAISTFAAAAAQSIDDLYNAAKKEGALVIVGGGPAPPYEKSAQELMQEFPGIKVSVTGGSSNEHVKEIDKQIAAGELQIDLAILQTVQDFERWKQTGALAVFKPDGFDKIDDRWKDPDGAYVGLYVNGIVYAYNTEKVKPESIPHSALDFLRPEFKGQIITTYPHVDDVTLYLYSTIEAKHPDFSDKLKVNAPSFVRGHLGVTKPEFRRSRQRCKRCNHHRESDCYHGVRE